MRKLIGFGFILLLILSLAAIGLAQLKSQSDVKVGETRFVCACGPECPCNSIAKKAGNCTCGKPMVEAKAVKVEAGQATFQIGDRQQVFKTVGKYACACGPDCPCQMISQNPGKCTCGKDMKAVN
ncbi:MAG: hypothetical protein HY892_19740 [Deltaproteobacteria bacterium]|nr:hypothetical protein [Deltaproteobacteria bacterium]